MARVLVIAESASVRKSLDDCLSSQFTVEFPEPKSLSRRAEPVLDCRFVFCEIDVLIKLGGRDGMSRAIAELKTRCPSAGLVVLAEPHQTREIVSAIQAGALNYLTCPIDADELALITRTVAKQRTRQLDLDYLQDETTAVSEFDTRNSVMRGVYEKLKMVAATSSTVLLSGETGVGKGVIARMIHAHSSRRHGPFVSVHCGAIPDTLLESELFGHEKGAFTGALRRKLGKFEIARGGTIFLDEIGTVTPPAQIKLLRVLQERQIQRLGGEEDLDVDVRIIAAANQDLAAMSAAGTFRTDLFYRLNIFPLHIPALRDRTEDIPLLVEVFIKRMNELHGRRLTGASQEVLDAFCRYSWPGNIRELENLIERACILEPGPELQTADFPPEILAATVKVPLSPADLSGSLAEARQRAVEAVEQEYLKQLLTRHRGRIKESAEAAGIGVRQLHKLLQKYDIHKADFKRLATG